MSGYMFHAIRFKEAETQSDGEEIWSVISLNCPGVASQGATADEALKNFKDAALGVLLSYEKSSKALPNLGNKQPPPGVEHLKGIWIEFPKNETQAQILSVVKAGILNKIQDLEKQLREIESNEDEEARLAAVKPALTFSTEHSDTLIGVLRLSEYIGTIEERPEGPIFITLSDRAVCLTISDLEQILTKTKELV